jgi:DNA invertase Pin-like site-specific DNA recombinase
VNGEHKITSGHRARTALVYLRQSTLVQVREHTESTMRQYALADTAVSLGWAPRDVEVIDRDLGLSGTSAAHRQGFRELMSRVCLGEVGAVIGLEISRLARSNADLARLAEMARLTGTLLIDSDGVYDLSDFNDWLVLGLKSTMSQAELHVMAGRLQAAKLAAAGRGELRAPLPVGLVYDDEGEVVIDPDAEVHAAVADVFACFAAAGSAYGVVAAFAGRKFPQRAYGGAWAGQLRWGPLTHHRVLQVLKNPAYAGAYVHGRHVTRKRVDADGNVRTSTAEVPRAEWKVLIKDHHPGYVTWDEYLAIEARLAANWTASGARTVREGSALCQGIIYCGSCGGPMVANYQGGDRANYECHSRRDGKKAPGCRGIATTALDDAVARVLLDALTPGQVALALAAADQVAGQHQRASRAAELAVERARYEADRAERALGQVEPENRLVARTLEARWETRLAALAEAEQALESARAALPPLPDRDTLARTAADLPALWHAPTTTARDRKRLLRTLIADVTLLPEPDRAKARIGIRWHAGTADQLIIDRPGPSGIPAATPSPAAELVRRLGPVTGNDELVAILARHGYLTGAGRPFDVKAVQWVRHVYKVPVPPPVAAGEVSVKDAAAQLGCSIGVVYYWIETGQLQARRGTGNRIAIPWDPAIQAGCRARIAESGHLNPDARRTRPRKTPRWPAEQPRMSAPAGII